MFDFLSRRFPLRLSSAFQVFRNRKPVYPLPGARVCLRLESLEARLAPAAVVFFESAVADYQVLRQGLSAGTDAVVLDSGGDGLREMAAFLASRHNLTSIGVVAHGSPGAVALGTATLDVQSLTRYARDLRTIGSALGSSGELDLWSCDVAVGQAGATLVQDLAEATGAGVAAADHIVGAAGEGGTWQLDVRVAGARGEIPFSAAALGAFHERLGTWSAAGSMAIARFGSAATLLGNGKVLVSGGTGDNGISLASAELYNPLTNSWSAAGSMATARTEQTATLLGNGKVLVTGGYDGINVLASAELYDPVRNTWSAVGTMATARAEHTATLLSNGQVLVTGGYNPTINDNLSSAELYDPVSETWSATGTMATARSQHMATLLGNGKVLVTGGLDNSQKIVSSAELYDPVSKTWSAAGTTARFNHTATLLGNGQVLVAGGLGYSYEDLSSAELYDPVTNTWFAAGSMATARDLHTATLLGNGKVLVAGGSGTSGRLSSAELYDPVSNTWSAAGFMATARWLDTATLLGNGQVLIAGGQGNRVLASAELYDPDLSHPPGVWNLGGLLLSVQSQPTATLLDSGKVLVAGGSGSMNETLSTAEVYDPVSGAWAAAGSMNAPRIVFTATRLGNGLVLVAGGTYYNMTAESYLSSAELYDPVSNTWSTTASMATARSLQSAILLANGKVLVVGGYNATGPVASAELYDPVKKTWAPAGSLKTARYGQTATLLANGKVLVVGGNNQNAVFASAELYDPALNTWSAAGSLITARYYHSATLLPSGKVLVEGGFSGTAFGSPYLASAELYDPVLNTWSAAASLSTARAQQTATLLSTGKVLIVGGIAPSGGAVGPAELYDPVTNTWSAAATPFIPRLYQTATLLGTGKVLIAGGGSSLQGFTTQAELYDPAGADPLQSTITVMPASVEVLYKTTSVYLTARDAAGVQETEGGMSFSFGLGTGSGSGTFSNLTDHHNGIYTAVFTGTLAGPITITATLNGQAIVSKSPTLNVTPADTTTVITSTPFPSTYGQAVTFTAAVATFVPISAGTVTFEDGNTILADNVGLDAHGHATFTIANLSAIASPHVITAIYSGTTQFVTSTGTMSQTVNPLVITVTADSQSKFVGATDPALTYRVTTGSLIPGDSFMGALARVPGESVGTYPIQQGTLALNGNYALTYVGANLVITPAEKFVVTVLGGNAIIAGSSFLVSVQVADPLGNPVSSYSGLSTIPITVADPLAVIPSAVSLNTSGFGYFIATLQTAGTYTITATDAANSISGSSPTLTVAAASAAYFKVDASATAVTNTTFPITVTALDAFNNVVPTYTGTVHLSSSDTAAASANDLGANYTFTTGPGQDNGVHVFNVQLLTEGNQKITVADTTATIPAIIGTSSTIATSGLTVTALTNTPTGFTATFNKAIDPTRLTLYGAGGTIQDVMLLGKNTNNNQPYPGTLIVDASKKLVTFNVSANFLVASSPSGSAALPDDTYTVTLLSGSGNNGFRDMAGQGFDDGHGGHTDYVGTFTTSYQKNKTQVLGISDFARGPNASGDSGLLVQVPNDPANGGHVGIPITIYNAASLTSAGFTLTYNANILTVTGGISDPSNASATFQMTSNVMSADGVHAVAVFAFTRATPQSGTQILGDVMAYVPYSARSQYQVKDLLALGAILVNGGAGVVPANAVDVNAYFGDVNGDHHLDGLDKGFIANVASTASTGFSAFTLLDPAIIGDLSGDNAVTSNSTSLLSNYLLAFPVTKIPGLPKPAIADNLFTSPFGFDPTLSLPATAVASNQGIVNVPVLLDHPRPEGSTGLVEAELALTYDPKVLSVSAADITLGSIPKQGTGWQLFAVVDAATGQIGIQLYSLLPITSDQAGSLVNIAFRVIADAATPTTAVQLVDMATPDGQAFGTVLADGQAAMILSTGVMRLEVVTGVAPLRNNH